MDFADAYDEHLARQVAVQLAARATLEQVEGWIDYVEHKGDHLTAPLGFLISRLRKREPPQDVRTYRELTFRDAAETLRMGAMRDLQTGVLEAQGDNVLRLEVRGAAELNDDPRQEQAGGAPKEPSLPHAL
jgi:hypothetical protein